MNSSHNGLYRPAPASFHDAGGPTVCVRDRRSANRIVELDRASAAILARLRSAERLETHAADLIHKHVVADAKTSLQLLQSLVERGLLVGEDAAAPPPTHQSAPSARRELTVAIVTADRPQLLRRCLSSLLAQCNLHGREPRVFVIDASRTEAMATQRAVAEARCGSSSHVDYVGTQTLAEQMHAATVDVTWSRETFEFALLSGGIGAARNLALLLTCGSDVLMLDDDVVADPWSSGEVQEGLAFNDYADPAEWRFFRTRRDAMVASVPSEADLLGVHSGTLGCCVEGSPLGGAAQHTIRVTLSGLAGDSGQYCPYRLLFLDGPVRAELNNQASLTTALTSREVARVVKIATVSPSPLCMAYAMGLANDAVVPPFLPIGRNEDGLFGATLAAIDTRARFCHLPVGVYHDSCRPSSYSATGILSASQTRLADVLLHMLRSMQPSLYVTAPERRMDRLGELLTEIGGMPRPEFIHWMSEVTLQARSEELRYAEWLVGGRRAPAHVIAALEQYRRAFVEAIQNPTFCLPIELRDMDVRDGFLALRHVVRQYGRLVRAWNETRAAVAAAAALREFTRPSRR